MPYSHLRSFLLTPFAHAYLLCISSSLAEHFVAIRDALPRFAPVCFSAKSPVDFVSL